MSVDEYESFDFIQQTGHQIGELLNADPSQAGWVESVKEAYNEDDECVYPQDTFEHLKAFLEGKQPLLDALKGIVLNQECPENESALYDSIFFPCDEIIHPIYNEEEDQNQCFTVEEEIQTAFTVMTPEILAQKQTEDIERIRTVANVSNDAATLLLKHFSWNSEKALQKYIENEEAIFKAIGISPSLKNESLGMSDTTEEINCDICCEDIPPGEACFLPCGHAYCKNCWADDLKLKIANGLPTLQCMTYGCNFQVFIDDVRKLCGDDVANNYQNFLLEDQILRDNQLIHCIRPGCDRVLTIKSVGYCNVAICECGQRICWKCHEQAHAPCTCDQCEEWKDARHKQWQIQRAQAQWERRENRLADWRRNHLQEIQDQNKKEENEKKKENERLNEQELKELNQKKIDLDKRLADYQKKVKNGELNEELGKELDNELKKLEAEKREQKIKQTDRNNDLNLLIEQHVQQINAISNSNYRKFYERQQRETEELRAWNQQNHTTDEWIEHVTKQCPKCKTRIEKSGGCNYMNCQRCHFEFCWVCGSDWKTHGDHFVCNKFDSNASVSFEGIEDGGDTGEPPEIDPKDNKYYPPPMGPEKRAEFVRFNHYNNRFITHRDAQKAEQKPRPEIRKVLTDTFLKDMSYASCQTFIDRLFRSIDVARSILIWSYPCAYLMPVKSKELHMFEIYQSNLEIFNEKIVGMCEHHSTENAEMFEHFLEKLEEHTEILLRQVDEFSK